MTPETKKVFQALRDNVERDGTAPGWGYVYLDNAIPAGMSRLSFAGHLSALTKVGLYKPEYGDDGFDGVFGQVKE